MDQNPSLHLYEQVLLLALRDQRGTPATSFTAQILAGAILAELLLAGRIRMDGRRVVVRSTQSLDDAVIDSCLMKIDASVPTTLKRWVSRLAGIRALRHQAARRLCRLGILREDSERFLLIFQRTVYREADPEPEQNIVERMREAIFGAGKNVEPRTAVLISLADGADLLNAVFGKAELKPRRQRIDQITHGDLTGQATRQVIEACKAAALIAATMPAVTSAAIN